MIKTACYVALVVVLVVLVAYEIYTDSKKQKAKTMFLDEMTGETKEIAETLEKMCEDLAKMYDNYDITATFDMQPKKHQDKPEE